jgi:hypothetical protein
MGLNVYKVEDAERHWFIAESEEQVRRLYKEVYNEDVDGNEASVELMPLEHRLTIDTEGIKETKTCEEWITSDGAGFLASTVW